MTRLEKVYSEKVVPELLKEFGYSSSMEIPKLTKISLKKLNKGKENKCSMESMGSHNSM